MRRQKRLTWFTAGYAQAAVVFPFVATAPRYFRGEIPLGGLVQTATAFGQVQDALSFVVTSYTDIAEWRAVVERLAGFSGALARVAGEMDAGGGITRVDDDRGTLRGSVTYPSAPGAVDDAAVRQSLAAVGLSELAGRLDERGHWEQTLSPGEQQRLAFARALVHQPDWLFLDEATSAVDEATEVQLYRLLQQRLPGTAVFSVGHRSSLTQFHRRRIVVSADGEGSASLSDVRRERRAPRRRSRRRRRRDPAPP